jgi:Tfp pilus assembly protein PilN
VRAVNLLPPDTRGASKSSAELAPPEAKGGAGAFVVLGVLAACVAGAAGIVVTNNSIKQHTADLDAAAQRQTALQAQVTKLKPYADFDAAAKARVQTVQDLATSRFDWEQALRDLSRAIPQDVTLKQLSGDIATDAGGQGGSLRGAISAPAITLTGCAPGQTQVARLMARLRDVDGVTRVSLASSSTEIATAVDEGSEIQRRLATPCGSGKRPAFEVVMFFEGDASKVAATPVTATGTVSETPTPTPTPDPSATPDSGTTGTTGTETTTSTTTTDGATK